MVFNIVSCVFSEHKLIKFYLAFYAVVQAACCAVGSVGIAKMLYDAIFMCFKCIYVCIFV